MPAAKMVSPTASPHIPHDVRQAKSRPDVVEDGRGSIWLLRPRPAGEAFRTTEDAASSALMAHGLYGWAFGFGWGKRTLGTTRVRVGDRTGTIRLSRHLVDANMPDVLEDTLLHEIAHALAYQRFGRAAMNHGPAWQAIAREVGAEPRATCAAGPLAPAPYVLVCERCGEQVGLFRKPKHRASRYRHRKCGGTFRAATPAERDMIPLFSR